MDGFRPQTKNYLIELHDIAPRYVPDFERIFAFMNDVGAGNPLILVSPLWGTAALRDESQVIGEAIERLNGEVVLHGLRHTAPGTLWDRVWYGERHGAEFSRLHEEQAFRLIEKGRAVLELWTKRPVEWFCAPRWKMGKGTIRALARMKFRGYLSKHKIVPMMGPPVIPMPVIYFDCGKRKSLRALNLIFVRRKFQHYLNRGKSFRLVIHPGDLNISGVKRTIDEMLGKLANRGWKPLSLSRLLKGEANTSISYDF